MMIPFPYLMFLGKENSTSTLDGCTNAGLTDLFNQENKCHNVVMEETRKDHAVAEVEEQSLSKKCPRKKRLHRSHSTDSNHSVCLLLKSFRVVEERTGYSPNYERVSQGSSRNQ